MIGEILKRSLETEFFLKALEPHSEKLMGLFEYASRTAIKDTVAGTTRFAWSSGHTRQRSVESWATASVFDFAQAMRRAVGCWTRSAAQRSLHAVIRREENPQKRLLERGDTWSEGPTAAEQLASLFLNSFFGKSEFDAFEPDTQPIEDNQARSAILFGPPGTSKTTLVRSLATVLGWHFVELHASDFVAEGLGDVQKTADKIFKQLMELDHTVVLFDEIDELVREREGAGTETFGRFLTTSMLPKLAQLWEQRKVLYFVNTNHIPYFDAAITRAERFDAVLFVPPPSYSEKKKELEARLKVAFGGRPAPALGVGKEGFEKALKGIKAQGKRDSKLAAGNLLAKFILLRWDQMDELASLIAARLSETSGTEVDSRVLKAALKGIKDRRLETVGTYLDFLRDKTFERRDHERSSVYLIEESADRAPTGACVIKRYDKQWLTCARERWKLALPDYDIKAVPDKLAVVRIIRRNAASPAPIEGLSGTG